MLRETLEADLPTFYEHQADPQACAMAAFNPRDLAAFLHHWRTNILGSATVHVRTIVHADRVAGYVSSYLHSPLPDPLPRGETEAVTERRIAYWIGREFWGLGLATNALKEFIASVDQSRPLDALVATSNFGSMRVLEKNGFQPVANSLATGDDGIEEVRYRLSA